MGGASSDESSREPDKSSTEDGKQGTTTKATSEVGKEDSNSQRKSSDKPSSSKLGSNRKRNITFVKQPGSPDTSSSRPTNESAEEKREPSCSFTANALTDDPVGINDTPITCGATVFVFPRLLCPPDCWVAMVKGHVAVGMIPCRNLSTLVPASDRVEMYLDGRPSDMLEHEAIWARVLYNFDAETSIEMSVRAGDLIRVGHSSRAPPGWIAAAKSGGRIGLVPTRFVVTLSPTADEDIALRAMVAAHAQQEMGEKVDYMSMKQNVPMQDGFLGNFFQVFGVLTLLILILSIVVSVTVKHSQLEQIQLTISQFVSEIEIFKR